MYSYTQAGLPASQAATIEPVSSPGPTPEAAGRRPPGARNLDSTYTYNNEGEVTAMTYPGTTPGYTNGVPINVTGASYNYSYDTMSRLAGMTDSGSNTIVSNVSYDASDRLLTMNYPGGQRNAQLQCARPAGQSSRQR